MKNDCEKGSEKASFYVDGSNRGDGSQPWDGSDGDDGSGWSLATVSRHICEIKVTGL